MPAIFTVTNNAPTGAGSLRQALLDANATAGEDIITFNLPAGQEVIMPSAQFPFPVITESVIIDGKTQSGYVPSTDISPAIPAVILDGSVAGNVSGFTANNVGRLIVDGMIIRNFNGDGVRITLSGSLSMTDVHLLSNLSDGVEANTITNALVGVRLRGISAKNQVNGAGINLTNVTRYSDTNSIYENNAENGIRLEDINGDVHLVNVTSINNNFDQVSGTGSGFVAFDGFDSDLHAIRGDVRFEGCNFGTSPFAGDSHQRQVDGVRILGVQGTIRFTNYVNSLGQLQTTQANFNRGDGVRIEAAADITFCEVYIDRGSFSNNLGDGIDISLFGVGSTNVGNVDIFNIQANSNGESGLEALAIPGTLTIRSGNASEVSTFNFNGQAFSTGDGLTLRNVNIIDLRGGVPGVGIVADRNADAGMEIITANRVTDIDGKYTNNGNSGIRVVDVAGDVHLTRPVLQNNDFDTNNSGAGFEALDGADSDLVAIGGNLTILGGRLNATLGSPQERQFRGISVDGVGGNVLLAASSGLVFQTNASNNSDDGVFIRNVAGSVTIDGGNFSFNGQVTGMGDGTGDGIDLELISGNVTLTAVTVNDNGNHGLEASNITGTITISNFGGNSTFNNNGRYLGPSDPQGGDGINLFNVNAVVLNPTNNPVGVSASGNRAAPSGAFQGRGGRGLFINRALGTLTDSIGNFSNNHNGGIILIDMNADVILTRTTANTNDFDTLPDDLGLQGDGLRATDEDGDGFAIRGNLIINGGRFSDAQPGAPTQAYGIYVDGVGGDILFQNAGAITTQANDNQQAGAYLANGVNLTIINGSYSRNGGATSEDGLTISGFTGQVTITNVTANQNFGDGIELDNVAAATITGGSYQNNLFHGMNAFTLGTLSVSNGNYSSNGLMGLLIDTITGNATLTSLTANGNFLGLNASNITGSLSVINGSYSSNTLDGISLTNVASTSLTNVVVNSNVNGYGLVGNSLGPVSISGGTFNLNNLAGIYLDTVTGSVSLQGVNANRNGEEGLRATGVSGSVSVDASTFDENTLEGVDLLNVGNVIFTSVTSSENLTGARIENAASFSDTGGVYILNQNHGIHLIDINGSVTLNTTRADDNDTNPPDGTGDGLRAEDGGDANSLAINGALTIVNSLFRNTAAGGPQINGINVGPVGGLVTLDNVIASGNTADGVRIAQGNGADVFDGDFSSNGGVGLFLSNITGTTTIQGSNASDNGSDGIRVFNSGTIFTDTVTADGNGESGLYLDTVFAWTDLDGNYSANDDRGIRLVDVATNVTLVRTVAQDNDSDGNGHGDGLLAIDGGDADALAIGGTFTARGVNFSNSNPGGPQQYGIWVEGVGVDFVVESDPLFALDSVIEGNAVHGIFVDRVVGRDVRLTRTLLLENGSSGLLANNVGRHVVLTSVEANTNGFAGVRLNSVGGSVTVSNSFFLENADYGLSASDVTGNVTVTNSSFNDNNSNGGLIGTGLALFDGPDGDNIAVNGNVSISNSNFLDTGIGQQTGVFIERLAGSLSVSNSNAVGNQAVGFEVGDGGTTGSFTGGNYSSNGLGILLNSLPGGSFSGNVTLNGVTASNNTGSHGVFAVNLNGTTTISGGSFNGNAADGLRLIGNGAGRNLVLNGTGSASNNGADGLYAENFGGNVTISGNWTFNNNGDDGIEIRNSGAVSFTNVIANGNDPGANIIGVASFTDVNGTYSNNANDGLRLTDVAGNVTLIRTVAENNDADNDFFGAGVRLLDGADVDGFAVGGNLVVQGVRLRAVGGGFQQHGLFADVGLLSNAIGGNVTFQDSVGPVQSVEVSGNRADGVFIRGANNGTFTNGSYSNNGDDGINLISFNNVTVTNVTANGNGGSNNFGDGIEINTAATVTLNRVTASNNTGNQSRGFNVSNATTLNISDFTGVGNGSGNGGRIDTVTNVNFTTTTTPANVQDDVTLAPGFFQHTRAGTVLQPITYNQINTLSIFMLDGDDQLIFVGGDYSPFFTGANPTLNVDGGSHIIGDALTFNATSGPDLIVSTNVSLTINGVPVSNPPGISTINLTNFEILGVNGLEGDDTFAILGFPFIISFPALRFNGNEGNDLLDASLAPLTPGFVPFLNGNEGNDTIIGGPNTEFIDGGADDDFLVGGGGNDTILGGPGNDSIDGGAGDDSLVGGSGSDTFIFSGAGLGSDTIVEAAGNVDNDWLDFSGFTAGGVNIDLSQSSLQVVNAGNLQLTLGNSSAIEHVLGSNAADNIVGNAGNNILIGLDGNDVIDGGAGNDTIDGGLGNDLLIGGTGDDSILGGAGDDTLNGGAGNDTLVGGSGSDRYLFAGTGLGSDSISEPTGGVDGDTLDFSLAGFAININLGLTTPQTVSPGNLTLQLNASDAVENVDGSPFNDTITGNASANLLNGNAGNDSILGLGGNDTLDGGAGNDTLIGGAGNDTVLGGADNDLIIWNPGDGNQVVDGGTGTDTVQINGSNAAGDNFVLQQHGLDPARQVFSRTNLTPFTMDIGTVEVYEVNSQGGDDTFTVQAPISGPGNGDVTTLNINTGTGNDLVVFDFTASNLLPTTNLNGGTGNDVLRIEGNGTPFTNETYSATGPDSGTINLDGQLISYSLMERLQQTKAGTNLLFQATAGNDSIGLTDGPVVNGFQTSSINSLNGLFVGLDFANKVFATVSGMGGQDSFTLTNPNPAAGLTQWTVNGGTTASAASDADTSGDVFRIQPTSIPINVNGGKPVNVYPGDRLDILPPNPGQSLTLTGKHDGTYTFTGLAPVNFTSIEDFSGIQVIVVGTDHGQRPRIRVYAASDAGPAAVPFLDFRPFNDLSGFRGGVRVAAGDVNGDGYPDIIAACGPGRGGSLVRVFDGYLARLGIVSQIGNFRPFGTDWNKGLYVAVGDLDADGFGDIVVSTGGPAKAQVRVFSGVDVISMANPPRQKFNAFPTSFRGGCNVAVGDYDGDGRLDIIVGAGPSGTPRVRVFDGTTFNLIDDFLAFDASHRRGIYVGAVDVDNDGIAEIIVSRNVSGLSEIQPFDLQVSTSMNIRPEVRTFDFTTNQGGTPKTATASATVFPANYSSGIRLGGWSDGGNTAQFLAVNGPGVAPGLVKKLDASLADSIFTNYAAESSGFFVAGSQRRFGLPLP